MKISEMEKKNQKFFFHLEIIAIELVALNTRLYWERILVKLSDTTKTEFFELIFLHTDQKMWQKYYRADLSSGLNPLTCWLLINVLSRFFLGI